jgi:hypothetical protein
MITIQCYLTLDIKDEYVPQGTRINKFSQI